MCPYCESPNVQTGAKHKTMGYRCRPCRKRFSVKAGTVMESSKKLHRDLDVSQKAAWHLAHRLRAALTVEANRHNGPAEMGESHLIATNGLPSETRA